MGGIDREPRAKQARSWTRFLLVGAALIGNPHSLLAIQDGVVDRKTPSFDSGYFATFSPKTAYDMLVRVPGFQIEAGGGNDRGLGLADVNVLLNGRRISGKSVDAVSVLEDISAADVQRIELLDASKVDIPGLSGTVANVVYSSSSGISGRFSYEPAIRRNADINWWNGSISLSGGGEASEWTVGLRTNVRRTNQFGPRLRFSPEGALLSTRNETSDFARDGPSLTATYSHEGAGGSVTNVNALVDYSNSRESIAGDVIVDGMLVGREKFSSPDEGLLVEFGADHEFSVGKGRLKLIGLGRYDVSSSSGRFEEEALVAPLGTATRAFERNYDAYELIARGEYRLKWGGTNIQFSAEGAYNRLDNEFSSQFEVSGEPSVSFLNEDVVDERRAEFIGTAARKLGNAIDVQASAGFELSQISAGSSGAEARSFARPKGEIGAGWRASKSLTVNLKAERSVDQLDFFDFLSDIDLVNDFDRGENPELVPTQRWTLSTDAKWNPTSAITLSPEASVIWFDDIIELVPISDTIEALGNVDKARQARVGGKVTIETGFLGLKGGRLDIEGTKAWSKVLDPLTGQSRSINNSLDYNYAIRFRHDIPGSDWAWGGELFRDQFVGTTRLTEEFRTSRDRPYGGVFLEHKDVLGMTASVWLNNILDARSEFSGTEYVARRDGPIAFNQEYSRISGRFVQLSLQGSF